MIDLPLIAEKGHLFTEFQGGRWLLDTGAPTSFGADPRVAIGEDSFDIPASYMGLDHEQLTGFVGATCRGLLGADFLNGYDALIDSPKGRLTLTKDEAGHPGTPAILDSFMDIPIVEADCGGRRFRLFLDTGAQISYLQDDMLWDFPRLGAVRDFYPGFGDFETDTHEIPFTVGGLPFTVRCGRLPALLVMSLAMADVQGILGNSFMTDRTVGYFPRRGLLYL